MKFQIEVLEKGARASWWETYDKEEVVDEATARAYAKKMIDYFNSTLRSGEKRRSFVGGIKLIDEGTREHKWTKSNVVTLADHRGAFDNVTCKTCGARARRYGLWNLKMQRGYTAKKWKTCPGPQS